MDGVAVFNEVVFAFEAKESFFFGGGVTAAVDEVFPTDDFGFDEAFFEVGVDDAGGFWRGANSWNSPSAGFFRAGCEVCH